jgi:hypothetical protein
VCGLYQSAELLQEWPGWRDQAERSAPNSADNKGVVFTFLHAPPAAKATAIRSLDIRRKLGDDHGVVNHQTRTSL